MELSKEEKEIKIRLIQKNLITIGISWLVNFIYLTTSIWFSAYTNGINHWSHDALICMVISGTIFKIILSYLFLGTYFNLCKVRGIDYDLI